MKKLVSHYVLGFTLNCIKYNRTRSCHLFLHWNLFNNFDYTPQFTFSLFFSLFFSFPTQFQVFRPLFHVGKVLWVDKVTVSDKTNLDSEPSCSILDQIPNGLVCNGNPGHADEDFHEPPSEKTSPNSPTDSSDDNSEKSAVTVARPVVLQEEPFEWQRTHIGHRLIADHWPHEYQKTLKLFLEVESSPAS